MADNPLFGPNKLKLGLFGLNVDRACAITNTGRNISSRTGRWSSDLQELLMRPAWKLSYRWRGGAVLAGRPISMDHALRPYTWAAGVGERLTKLVFSRHHMFGNSSDSRGKTSDNNRPHIWRDDLHLTLYAVV